MGEVLKDVVVWVDVVFDCIDNMVICQKINVVCVVFNMLFIIVSVVGFGGQLMVLMLFWEQGCYCCLWLDNQELECNCCMVGVVGLVVGVMGILQVLEVIKLLSGIEIFVGEF